MRPSDHHQSLLGPVPYIPTAQWDSFGTYLDIWQSSGEILNTKALALIIQEYSYVYRKSSNWIFWFLGIFYPCLHCGLFATVSLATDTGRAGGWPLPPQEEVGDTLSATLANTDMIIDLNSPSCLNVGCWNSGHTSSSDWFTVCLSPTVHCPVYCYLYTDVIITLGIGSSEQIRI